MAGRRRHYLQPAGALGRMKIHAPIDALPASPPANPSLRPDRQPAYLAAKRSAGLWVPVECDSYRAATYLANGARRHVLHIIEAQQRGSVVYLRYIGQAGVQLTHLPTADRCAREALQRVSE